MNELDRIKDQLRRSYEGEAWHGPSVLEALDGLSDELASRRLVRQAHTVWEIILHITGTQNLVLRRLRGNATPQSPEEDWPSVVETGPAAFRKSLDELQRSFSDLGEAIGVLNVTKIDQPILPGHSSTYVTLHGVVQHNLYHAGQIALLRKV